MENDTLIFKPLIDELKSLYQNQLEEHNATGKLSQFDYDIEWDEKSFRVYFNLQEYWKWVEYGRRAGKQPPITPIEEWIKVKKIVPKTRNGRVPTTKQLAFAISKSIGEHGTPANKPLSNALGSVEATSIISQIKELLIKQINSEIKDVIKPILSK